VPEKKVVKLKALVAELQPGIKAGNYQTFRLASIHGREVMTSRSGNYHSKDIYKVYRWSDEGSCQTVGK
jgi:hypothetical protein